MEKHYPPVSIIIVNKDGGEVIKKCWESLSKIEYPNWELIVVDNGSSDGSENFSGEYKLIKNTENRGFAEANNQGVKVSSGKYILLLNNDTKVTSDFLMYLVEKLETNPDWGVVQPKLKIMDNPKLLDNSGAFLTRSGFLEHWGYMAKDSPEFDEEKVIFSAKGACMLIRKEIIDKVGLFDNDFGSYMEETDFCWRVWLLGYKVVFTPGTFIYHKVGFTSKKQNQISVNYNSFKNRIATLIKNLNFMNLIGIGGFHISIVLALFFYYLVKLQFAKAFMVARAVLWNIFHLPSLLGKRAFVQKHRKKTDPDIFKSIMHSLNLKGMFMHFAKVEANFK